MIFDWLSISKTRFKPSITRQCDRARISIGHECGL